MSEHYETSDATISCLYLFPLSLYFLVRYLVGEAGHDSSSGYRLVNVIALRYGHAAVTKHRSLTIQTQYYELLYIFYVHHTNFGYRATDRDQDSKIR